MGVNSLPKTVTRQRRGCNLNPGPSAPESSTLTTRLPRHRTTVGEFQQKHFQQYIHIGLYLFWQPGAGLHIHHLFKGIYVTHSPHVK